jgi:hypothetical protein
VKRQAISDPCLFLLQFCKTKTYIMKKSSLLLAAAIVVSVSASAQFTKGDRLLGAGLNISHSKSESTSGFTPYNTSANNGSLTLSLAFASSENRVSGFYVGGGYGKSKTEYPAQPTNNYSSENFNTSAGFYTRRYRALGKDFFLFAEGRAGVDFGKNQMSNTNDQTFVTVSAGIYPGISYRAGKRFLLDLRFADFASIGYTRNTYKGSGNTKDVQNIFGISSSLGLGYLSNIGIGARWIIPAGRGSR